MRSNLFFGLIALIAVVLMPLASWWGVAHHRLAQGWGLVALSLIAFAAISGRAIVGSWRGLLIDQRNVISLSRFQMALWTVIVLSAYLAAAMFNIITGVDEPLSIALPGQLWLLMGISTASLVGTPLILSDKLNKKGSDAALNNTLQLIQAAGGKPEETRVMGQLLGNQSPQQAGWQDMVTGDEVSNGAHLDLSKLQMLLFTLVIAMAYAGSLWRTFVHAQPDGITLFPALDDSTLALLGISHAGYLGNKVVPRASAAPPAQ